MSKDTVEIEGSRVGKESKSALDELLQEGARRMLQAAVEGEVAEYIDQHQHLRDCAGHRLVVRNGSLPQREIHSGVGRLRIKQPRVNDRREHERFTSRILPPFMRRTPSIDSLIPALYLKGISTSDFSEALSAILGENAAGLSATNIVRLKAANVLDKLPKRVQPHAKGMLHEMYLSPTKADAERACEAFLTHYGAKYPKACDCLRKDREVLFTFYDFPAEHWAHIRTTNPIESTFATVRHRTRQTKGCGSRLATLTMVFMLARQAEKNWRKINAYKLMGKVIEGMKFVDGELKEAA